MLSVKLDNGLILPRCCDEKALAHKETHVGHKQDEAGRSRKEVLEKHSSDTTIRILSAGVSIQFKIFPNQWTRQIRQQLLVMNDRGGGRGKGEICAMSHAWTNNGGGSHAQPPHPTAILANWRRGLPLSHKFNFRGLSFLISFSTTQMIIGVIRFFLELFVKSYGSLETCSRCR